MTLTSCCSSWPLLHVEHCHPCQQLCVRQLPVEVKACLLAQRGCYKDPTAEWRGRPAGRSASGHQLFMNLLKKKKPAQTHPQEPSEKAQALRMPLREQWCPLTAPSLQCPLTLSSLWVPGLLESGFFLKGTWYSCFYQWQLHSHENGWSGCTLSSGSRGGRSGGMSVKSSTRACVWSPETTKI